MTTKLRWMTIVVLAVLLSAGPVAALDGARDDGPGIFPQLIEWITVWLSPPEGGSQKAWDVDIRTLDGAEDRENDGSNQPPPLDEAAR